MRVLVVTNMYPQPDQPDSGTFVKDQVEALRCQGLDVDVLLINGPKSRLNYLWGPFQLWGRLMARQYDLIHAHYVFSGIISRLQPFLPLVVTYHGSELGNGPEYWLSRLSRLACPFFDQVIVVSTRMKRMLNRNNVCVIPCGVDLDKVRPISLVMARQQLGLPLDKPLLLWIGDPQRAEKGYELLEKAISLLAQDLPDMEVVHVVGQPYKVIPIYMSACDVLALTSVYEGSPMVIKEAMACNLPIVSTDVGDVASVVDGAEYCYIVESTPQAIAEKLRLVLSRRHRTNGRSRIGYLELDLIAKRIKEVYKALLFNHLPGKPTTG